MAVEAGASALGLVSHMPSGPGVISDEQIAETAATVPPPIATFLLTSRQWVPDIVEHRAAYHRCVVHGQHWQLDHCGGCQSDKRRPLVVHRWPA